MKLHPFVALRPPAGREAEVASPPYDVISTAEARALAAAAPASFLHVIRPEIDLDPDIDVHDERVYAQGAASLRRLVEEGALVFGDGAERVAAGEVVAGHVWPQRDGHGEEVGRVLVLVDRAGLAVERDCFAEGFGGALDLLFLGLFGHLEGFFFAAHGLEGWVARRGVCATMEWGGAKAKAA